MRLQGGLLQTVGSNFLLKTKLLKVLLALVLFTPQVYSKNAYPYAKEFVDQPEQITVSLPNLIPFQNEIFFINTDGYDSLNFEYTGITHYYKIIVLYTSANKTQDEINILLNGEKITRWQPSDALGANLNSGKKSIEIATELTAGDIITVKGSNTKAGQAGLDYIKIEETDINNLPNQAPIADFQFEVQGNMASFDASTSQDPDGKIAVYQWSFGDGIQTKGKTTDYTYQTTGSYHVTLTVTDNKGAKTTINRVITISTSPNELPTADFTYTIIDSLQLTVILDASSSADADGKIVSYQWNIEDGGGESGKQVTYTFSEEGLFYINLSVTDDQGGTNEISKEIFLSKAASNLPPDSSGKKNLPPTATLHIDQTSGVVPFEFEMDATGSSDADGFVTSYVWDFGDGQTASGDEVTHTYYVPGTYTLTLTVFDNENAQHTITREITVTAPQKQGVFAQYRASESNSLINQSILFDGSYSKSTDGSAIVAYEWEMGDGSKLEGQKAYYAFKQPGTYYPLLRITNKNGQADVYTDKIMVRDTNLPPKAYAGDDKILHTPNPSITLTGAGSDEDGKIASYEWTFLSGTEAIEIRHPESPFLPLSKLAEGSYVFRLTVIDNNGASTHDDVKVLVISPATGKNKLPVVYAGEDIITNKNMVTIKASAHDPDGEIVSYRWEQVFGQPITLFDQETLTLELTHLSEGEYLFRITATDNEGDKGHDDVKIIYHKNKSIITAKKAFTPNGDGIDDTWRIENSDEIQDCQLIIMDRSGNKVFEASPYQNEWDATIHGTPLPNADYYYVIRCQDGKTEAGGVRVIR